VAYRLTRKPRVIVIAEWPSNLPKRIVVIRQIKTKRDLKSRSLCSKVIGNRAKTRKNRTDKGETTWNLGQGKGEVVGQGQYWGGKKINVCEVQTRKLKHDATKSSETSEGLTGTYDF